MSLDTQIDVKEREEVLALTWAYLDKTISKEDLVRFKAMLKESSSARQTFQDGVQMESLLKNFFMMGGDSKKESPAAKKDRQGKSAA